MSETFEKISAVLDGVVPAAGGDVEVLIDEDALRDLSASACQTALYEGINEEAFARLARTVEQRCRAHVTRLQAENAALQQRLNVADQQNDKLTAENARLQADKESMRRKSNELNDQHLDLLQDVLDAKEVMLAAGCDQAQFSEMFKAFSSNVGALKTKVDLLSDMEKQATEAKWAAESELTKARELLKRVTAYGRVHFDLNDCDVARVEAYEFLARQSAPAAKDGSDE